MPGQARIDAPGALHHIICRGIENRYKSILCQEDPYLKELVRYIHLNPLRAGIVEILRASLSIIECLSNTCQIFV